MRSYRRPHPGYAGIMPSVPVRAGSLPLLLLLLAACSSKSSPPAARPLAPLLPIVGVEPAAGGVSLGYRSAVVVTFGEDLVTAEDADFEVSDGLGPLAGVRDYDVAARTWSWQPVQELPRGAVLTATIGTGVRGRLGGELPAPYRWSFRVLEGSFRGAVELDGLAITTPLFAVSSRTGVAAVAAGTQVHDWAGGSFLSTAVASGTGRIEAFAADRLGQVTAVVAQSGAAGFALTAAQRPLQGSWQMQPMDGRGLVLGLCRLQSNAQGARLCYWYASGGTAAGAEALLWSPDALASFEPRALPSAPPFTIRSTAIDNLGSLWYLHADPMAGTLVVGQQQPWLASASQWTLPMLPTHYRFGVDGAGRGQLVVEVTAGNDRVLWWYRGSASAGFAAPRELARSADVRLGDLQVADSGEAILIYQDGGGYFGRRLDADGNVGEAVAVAGQTPPVLTLSPRGEAWLVQWAVAAPFTEMQLQAVRWRVGGPPEAARVVAVQPVTHLAGRITVAVDESGRAVVAWLGGAASSTPRLFANRFE